MADVKRLSGSAMRILYVLLAIIQFSFAFHAVKSGRGAMWVTIIIVFPVAGPLAYYFMEVFPASREERALRRRVRDIAKAMNPDAELQRRTEEVAQTASVENRAEARRRVPRARHVRRGDPALRRMPRRGPTPTIRAILFAARGPASTTARCGMPRRSSCGSRRRTRSIARTTST